MMEERAPTALETRRTADGRRRLQLTRAERNELARARLIEGAVALFLNIEGNLTYAQIAEQLGISVKQLKDLTRTEEFEAAYNELFVDLGRDPRLQATRSALTDLLPLAFQRLREAITGAGVPWTVRKWAVDRVFELNGVEPSKSQESDRRQMAKFLEEAGVKINEMHIHLPNQYEQALGEVMEGEVREVEALNVPEEPPPDTPADN